LSTWFVRNNKVNQERKNRVFLFSKAIDATLILV